MRRIQSWLLALAALSCCLLLTPPQAYGEADAPSSAQGTIQESLDQARRLADLGRDGEALPLLQRVLEFVRQQPVSSTLASLANETAVTQYRLGHLEAAEALYREAILAYQTSTPRDDAGLATALNNLAALYHRKRDFEGAEPLYQQALSLRREALGPNHPNVAFSLNELAMLYHSQRRLEDAAALYEESLAIEEGLLGASHADLAPRLTNLAVIYRLQGLFNRAEPLFLRALEIQRQTFGEEHPEVAVAINNLAVLYSVMGRFEEAETLYRQALAVQERVFGEQHISVAMGLRNLAILFGRQGEEAKARQTVLQIRQILNTSCADGDLEASSLTPDDRAVCRNALAMQQQLVAKLGIDLQPQSSSAATVQARSSPPSQSPPSPPPPTVTPSVEPTEKSATSPIPNGPANGAATEAASSSDKTVFRAQVRSAQELSTALGELESLTQAFAETLAGQPGRVQRVDLGAKGVWYRVQFGAFETPAAAKQLCNALQRQGLESCWVSQSSP